MTRSPAIISDPTVCYVGLKASPVVAVTATDLGCFAPTSGHRPEQHDFALIRSALRDATWTQTGIVAIRRGVIARDTATGESSHRAGVAEDRVRVAVQLAEPSEQVGACVTHTFVERRKNDSAVVTSRRKLFGSNRDFCLPRLRAFS